MKGHGYVLLPSRLVGRMSLDDSDVSTSAAWSTGHSAIHPLVTLGLGPLHLWRVCILPCEWVAPLEWSGKLGEPLRENTLTFRSCQNVLDYRGVGFIPLVGC